MTSSSRGSGLTRRQLLGAAAATTVGAAIGLEACSTDQGSAPQPYGEVDNEPFDYLPPRNAPTDGILRFFTKDEFRAVDALAAQIMPGTPDDPGAHEAGVAVFIDTMLAQFDDFDEPTYHEGPFVGTDDPAEQATLPPGVDSLSKDDLKRYGFQSALTPQQTYRTGLAALDSAAREQFGAGLADLDPAQQQAFVSTLEDGSASGFDTPSASDFFDRVRTDLIHGMFGDPVYGGNRDMVGWRLIGYPGAQRAWTPVELKQGPNSSRRYQGLHELHASHPGRPAPSAIRPVAEPDPEVHP